jgi:hypothetical protein
MTASSKTCQPVALLRSPRYARSRQACIISVQVQVTDRSNAEKQPL